MILAFHHISKSFVEHPVLQDVTFHIEKGEKAAIVGINGAGKSTLLKIAIGQMEPDDGTITWARDIKYGYLAQNQNVDSDNTIYEELLEVKRDMIDMEEKISWYEKQMSVVTGEALINLMTDYTNLLHTFESLNGYAYKGEITGVLRGLGFTDEEFEKKIGVLSGGEKTRVALAKLLLEKPDLIILDEPTNHLDLNAIRWLETYLMNIKAAVLIVSHDRYFLDRVVTKIIEVENTKAMVFPGNYTAYADRKEKLRIEEQHAFLNNQAEIKHQEEVIAKLKSFNREKSIKRAESREKLLKKTTVLEKPVTIRDDMRISLAPCIKSGKDVLHVEDLSKSFEDRQLFSHLSFDIRRGEHVALIGDNGSGKTTILKILNGILPADAGHIRPGTNVHVGYYDQEHHVLTDENTVFEEIGNAYPNMNNTAIRNILAAFLFTGDDVFKHISELSGGEKGRVSLAKLMLSEANFLILDEPTNHLDITSKEVLENALNAYEGTVLYVSHDRYFINHTASRILSLTHEVLLSYPGNNQSEAPMKYIGNYDSYLEKSSQIEDVLLRNAMAERDAKSLTDHIKEQSTAQENNMNDASSGQASSSDRTEQVVTAINDWRKQKEEQAKLRKIASDLRKCEERITTLENKNLELETQMAAPDVCTNVGKLAELAREKEKNDNELEELYAEWEKLSE